MQIDTVVEGRRAVRNFRRPTNTSDCLRANQCRERERERVPARFVGDARRIFGRRETPLWTRVFERRSFLNVFSLTLPTQRSLFEFGAQARTRAAQTRSSRRPRLSRYKSFRHEKFLVLFQDFNLFLHALKKTTSKYASATRPFSKRKDIYHTPRPHCARKSPSRRSTSPRVFRREF